MLMRPTVAQPGSAGCLNPSRCCSFCCLPGKRRCLTPSATWFSPGCARPLIGDALTLLPRQRLLYAVGAFFLSHLLYTIYFASQMTLSFFWPLPLVLLVIGALLIAVIWSRLEEMRLPVCTFIAMTLVMVWLAGELWFFRPTSQAMSAFFGAALLLLGNIVWLGSHYRRRFRADNAIASACYFAGHFLIVRSLYI